MTNGVSLSAETLAILDSVPCGLVQTDAKGLLLRVNSTFCHWVGYSADELIGRRKLQDLFTMGGRIFHQTHWAPLLQMQGSVSEVKLEFLDRGGNSFPIVLNAIRHAKEGVVVHEVAIFVARDRDKYERELLQSRKRQEELTVEATRLQNLERDRALFAEQMVGIVSHDLRNPLSTIQMSAALLLRGGLTANQQRVLDRLSRAGARASRLITDLLDLTQARLGAGLSVSPKLIDLHAVVSEAVDELSVAFPERPLEHRAMGDGECQADPDRVAQLVGNLVANAVAYGEPGSEITITSSIEQFGFVVSVHNIGKPIAEGEKMRLFGLMVRGEGEASKQHGVGLGLFIVSEIMKAHGGSISVESTAKDGTIFVATFLSKK